MPTNLNNILLNTAKDNEMKTITIAGVEVRIYQGPVGIYVSGGADSALLLYLLMKYSTDTIHIFTCASKQKQFASARVSLRVIEKCVELTGNTNIVHHTHYVDYQTDEILFYPQKDYLHIGKINVLYTGITANPPLDVLKTFKEETTENSERDPSIERSVYIEEQKIYIPFTNINKQKIGSMYNELDLTDTLYSLTRSCESLELSEGHCGECWWCQERHWGFGKLE